MTADFGSQLSSMQHGLVVLLVAAVYGAAVGVCRPSRGGLAPGRMAVVQRQVLLSIVGAAILVVVAENLARALAIVGAAGLVQYRSRAGELQDDGVPFVALAVGLAVGAGLIGFGAVACVLAIVVRWVFESIEARDPPEHTRFDLTIASRNSLRIRRQVEHALREKGVTFELWGSSDDELRYEVAVPSDQNIEKLTKVITRHDGRNAIVDWQIRGYQAVRS